MVLTDMIGIKFMKYFTIKAGTQCEVEIYDHNNVISQVKRFISDFDIKFDESDLFETKNLCGEEGEFMRFGYKKKRMTIGESYILLVADADKMVRENRY